MNINEKLNAQPYRVALHIGLPKTATTSLQENLLYPAHEENMINYLGRYGSHLSSKYFNPFEIIFSELGKSDLDSCDVRRLQNTLFGFMKQDKLNVISEEILSSTHKFGYRRLENLKLILEPCDVKVIISLRQPIEFFYSYYAECYRWKFHEEKAINTIDKFLAQVLADANNQDFDILHFDRLLPNISNIFPCVTILLFEDLLHDKKCYIKSVSTFFYIEKTYVESQLFKEIRNTRGASKLERVSERVTLNQKVNRIIQKCTRDTVKKKIKNIPLIRKAYRLILNLLGKVAIGKPVQHKVSEMGMHKALEKSLSIDASILEKYKVEVKKLKKYGYCSDK